MALSQEEYHIAYIDRDMSYNRFKRIGRVYYYQGNFYHPLDLQKDEPGKVRRLICDFIKQNKSLVENDRKDSNYRTLDEVAGL